MPADGGRAALSGFLYQMVGVVGFRVWAETGPSNDSTAQDVDILLKLVSEGELRHEEFGQDAVLRHLGITGEDKCVLFQFKYSSLGQDSTIGQQDLKKIATRMADSAKIAQDQGYSVTKYFLITNRRLGPTADVLLKAVRSATPQSQQDLILRDIRVIPDLPRKTLENRIREFSRSFGLDEQEIDNGISKLIGDLIREASEGTAKSLTQADIIKAFTGDKNTKPLTASTVLDLSRSEIEKFIKSLVKRDWDELIYREFSDQIQAKALDRALVIICGQGGCGKTAIMSQWAYEKVNNSHDPNNAFISLISARRVPPGWIVDVVRQWGNLPDVLLSKSSSPGDALKRLKNANMDIRHPILHLGLDGIDEVTDLNRQKEIENVLEWFWNNDIIAQQRGEEPIATLLVTCRDRERLFDYLIVGDGFTNEARALPIVEVSDFSDYELMQAAEKSVSDLLPAIRRTLEDEGFKVTMKSFDLPPKSIFESSIAFSAEAYVVESLKHPAMWRSFLGLDPSQRQQALEGEKEALEKMSSIFFTWCTEKIRYRLHGLKKDEIKAILGNVAIKCSREGVMPSSRSKFIEFATRTGLVNDNQASMLYKECTISGLIRMDDAKRWRWRHEFVSQHLISQNQ